MVGGEQPGLTVKYEGIDQPGIEENGVATDVEDTRVRSIRVSFTVVCNNSLHLF